METFNWSPRTSTSATVDFKIRKAAFGDGYTQVSGEGIHPRSQKWALDFVGNEKYIRAILEFLDRHQGHKSFIWKPPLSDTGLYRCEGYKTSALGGKNYSLSAEFVQAYHA
ncbi:phage tail protein [Xenorhabdus bovienii]|uniref:Gp17 n=2 Tax=Xenorhabdus bovienii TaxID=40576 RepID=A0A0B6XE61_XENBV|nr:phage tail protein [Xenorhabdus bovienii]CDG90566.1 Phage minor tail protein [Xenorhabdus bovienii str. feltiae France]CDG91371.1 Phage minor tail protein [Xenorhabdus bovienii str. feltiae Florida]CDH23042.1 Phage minor tail protein [Xenorhabdus bovienii str. kraussei Becker Underwood]CDM90564.1 Gp17 [Xenorhabdus bovienii]